MADFRASSDKSTTDMNKVIEAFGSYLKDEREALSMICANIKLDNIDLNSTITTQLDNLKLEAEEAEVRNSAFILKNQMSLFPVWTIQQIQKEAIDLPELYWLGPKTSFDNFNDIEYQLDFPLTPRAFLFRCIQKIEKTQISNNMINRKLFNFYLKYG
ncbi:unnamed protein product [Lactuca saligna]|uniref:Uncharacterized protein n=1 Tax=Lactuca saligna TaxID=75948 RepID=A0AA35UT27_LACSI|nr:unnamed protein product [Lactuca saligna]